MFGDIIMDEIRKGEFYKCLDFYNINLSKIFLSSKSVNEYMKEEFNCTLRDLKNRFEFDVIESILIIERDWATIKAIFSILDEESKHEIRVELSKKYNKKILTTHLEKFIEWK